MTIRQKVQALLDYYSGSRMMLAIKLSVSQRTVERILNGKTEKVQPIREKRINELYNRVISSPDPSKPAKVKA